MIVFKYAERYDTYMLSPRMFIIFNTNITYKMISIKLDLLQEMLIDGKIPDSNDVEPSSIIDEGINHGYTRVT